MAGAGSSVTASLQYRAQDVGTSPSVYVFALAPASIVKNALAQKDALVAMKARDKWQAQDTPLPCVLAQLTASGQLQGVSASNLLAYTSGVLSAAGQAVTVLNNVSTPLIAGATFFVGYGPNSTTMSGRK